MMIKCYFSKNGEEIIRTPLLHGAIIVSKLGLPWRAIILSHPQATIIFIISHAVLQLLFNLNMVLILKKAYILTGEKTQSARNTNMPEKVS